MIGVYLEKSKKANIYLTHVVIKLFNSFRGAFTNRIYGLDFHLNWFHIVAFILFVIRVIHRNLDNDKKKELFEGIDFYIEDSINIDSYLNYFGSEDLKQGVSNYSHEAISNDTHVLIQRYIDSWNNTKEGRLDIAVSIAFINNFKTDDDNRHMTLAFDFIYKQFSKFDNDGGIELFR